VCPEAEAMLQILELGLCGRWVASGMRPPATWLALWAIFRSVESQSSSEHRKTNYKWRELSIAGYIPHQHRFPTRCSYRCSMSLAETLHLPRVSCMRRFERCFYRVLRGTRLGNRSLVRPSVELAFADRHRSPPLGIGRPVIDDVE
jgi:hypothetical protein